MKHIMPVGELQGVDQVVRGDDLASSTPRQILLQQLLGFERPSYLHVPLVLGPTRERLAKRDGAVTLTDLAGEGWGASDVVAVLARSLDLATRNEPAGSITSDVLIGRFDPERLPRHPAAYADLLDLHTPT